MKSNRQTNTAAADIETMKASERPFSRINYICMAASLAFIIVGFLLMAGPGSSVEGGFNPDIFSARRIIVGPTITFLGFLGMAFAIIAGPKSRADKSVPKTPETFEATVPEPTPADERTAIETAADERTVVESAADERTVVETASDEKTVIEPVSDEKTVIEPVSDEKTRIG